MARSSKQQDAHVRARTALARKVVVRRHEWDLRDFRARHAELFEAHLWDEIDGLLMAEAFEAIANYSGANARDCSHWREGWGNKYGAYSPFDGAEYLGQHKDIPATTVHSIICRIGQK